MDVPEPSLLKQVWLHISLAWSVAGQYFSKFVFTTLASSAVLENLRKTLLVPVSSEIEKNLMEMKSEIAGLTGLPEKIRQRFNSSYNQVKEAHLTLKNDTEAELDKGRKRCFRWSVVTVVVMSIGADSCLGPFTFLLLLPLFRVRRSIANKISNTQNAINAAREKYREDRQLVEDALAPYIRQTDMSLSAAIDQLDNQNKS